MPSRVEATATPSVLAWAREAAGLSVEEAADHAKVKAEKLAIWETGEENPSVPQLRKLAETYKRPLALFYLPEPPEPDEPLADFRRLPGETETHESSPLLFEIREARTRRETALDLAASIDEEPVAFSLRGRLSDDPERLAARIRETLGVTIQAQRAWRDPSQALRNWRGALEAAGVLVFQTSAVPVEEMRGFSISEFPFPAVVLNSKDAPQGRVFTLFHEVAHLVIRSGGVCEWTAAERRVPPVQSVEVYCNRVAGATLVPREALLAEPLVQANQGDLTWEDAAIQTLASRYKVSRETMLRRLLVLNRTSEAFYKSKRAQLVAELARRPPRRDEEVRIAPHVLVLSRAGYEFVRLVLRNYNQERITSSDVSDYLGMRLKHLEKIQGEALGSAVE